MSKKWKRHKKLSVKFLGFGLVLVLFFSEYCVHPHFLKMKNHLRCPHICALSCFICLTSIKVYILKYDIRK